MLGQKSTLNLKKLQKSVLVSQKSCKAAESMEDALLRMARVNCNF
jgi:hypothetical protein